MIGESINDTPILAAKDVSVSMKHSSDIAREVADISLLSEEYITFYFQEIEYWNIRQN